MPLPKAQPPDLQWNHSFSRNFHVIHLVSRVFGVSYFINIISVSSFLTNIPYTLALFTVFITTFLYRISSVPPEFCKSDAVSHSVIGIQQILATATIIAIYYQILFYKSHFKKLLKFISLIEHEFVALNIQFGKKRFTRKILCEVIAVVVFIYVSFLFFVIYYDVRHIELIMLELFSNTNPMLVIVLNLLTFTNFVWYIRNRFRHLKHFLVDMCAIDSLVTSDSIEPWKVKLTRKTPNGLHRECHRIAKIYELLFTVSNHLSDIFGFSNLASMGKSTETFARKKINRK